jgi:pilus assembly protein Flp/PilA
MIAVAVRNLYDRFRPPSKEGDNEMLKVALKLWNEEEGQDLVEYALLVVLIALGCVVTMQGLASAISDAFGNANAQLTSST